ncbi:MAG: class I SAM-dependent methyltransferase [Actinomycetota bacterium]|nr:class I SAM-dependent methyltransferase [Actinomycetota bacterium]
MKHEAWGRWNDLLDLEIDAAAAERLESYERLLLEKALPLGMVGRADRDLLRERHILDAVRAAPLLGPPPGQVADLGSGAGLPGIPLAIARPDLRFCMAELRRRRVAFIELAADSLRLTNVTVFGGKVEDLTGPFDVCVSRAFAEPARAWAVAEPLLSPTGKLLFWAGRSFDVASGTPEGARISVSAAPSLADAGPIVIMARQ